MRSRMWVKLLVFCGFFAIFLILLNFPTQQELFLSKITCEELPSNADIDLINRINVKNSKIKSIVSDNIEIQINGFRLFARMLYEKDRKFNMKIRSFLGKEVEIGSNNDSFWFWSKRMKPPYLHYASYKNLYNCGLKEAFHPLWMMESLSVGNVVSDAIIKSSQRYLLIIERRKSTSNSIVTKVTLIDKKNELIIGHYLMDDLGFIASAEIQHFNNLVPDKIVIIWHRENVTLYWNIYNIRINQNIDPYNWQMPYYKNKINMENN